jgi:hypothetical protein
MSKNPTPESVAHWAFVLTMIGTLLYSLVVYAFVLSADVEHDGAPYGASPND